MKAIERKWNRLIFFLLFWMALFFTVGGIPSNSADTAVIDDSVMMGGAASSSEETFASGPADVAFIGDSITMGSSASSPEKTYTSLITEELDHRGVQATEHRYISLDPSTDLTAAAEAATQAPHFVIIELGIHAAGDERVSPDEFRQTYACLLDYVSGDGAVVVAGTIPWLGWAPDSWEYERVEQFNGIIAEEAAERQVAVADVWSATELNPEVVSTPDDYAFLDSQRGDNFHPGDVGHALIAQAYAKAIDGAHARPSDQAGEMVCRADGIASGG